MNLEELIMAALQVHTKHGDIDVVIAAPKPWGSINEVDSTRVDEPMKPYDGGETVFVIQAAN